jgi:cytochrome c553
MPKAALIALIAGMALAACGEKPEPIKMSASTGSILSPSPAAAAAPSVRDTGELKYAGLCLGCHGQAGKGQGPFPRLAGKPAGELVEKLKDYRAGKTLGPQSATMMPFAKALTDREIDALAGYLAGR